MHRARASSLPSSRVFSIPSILLFSVMIRCFYKVCWFKQSRPLQLSKSLRQKVSRSQNTYAVINPKASPKHMQYASTIIRAFDVSVSGKRNWPATCWKPCRLMEQPQGFPGIRSSVNKNRMEPHIPARFGRHWTGPRKKNSKVKKVSTRKESTHACRKTGQTSDTERNRRNLCMSTRFIGSRTLDHETWTDQYGRTWDIQRRHLATNRSPFGPVASLAAAFSAAGASSPRRRMPFRR